MNKKILYTAGIALTAMLVFLGFHFWGTTPKAKDKPKPAVKAAKTKKPAKKSAAKQPTPSIKASGMDPKVANLASKAYACARKQGLDSKQILTVVDYSKPSTQKRMWVVDMKNNNVISQQLVSHGKGSGAKYAKHFSNGNGSHASSIGLYETENTYYGHKGLSLRLKGLDRGFNDHAMSRAVVIHGANYATQSFANRVGRLGLSWGCPAIDPAMVKSTINTIKQGTLVFAYYPDSNWLSKSKYLHC
ncbi:MAG: hypothetical protein CMF50_01210 [Legionellales bacterium]|nr:hypothetical protein [Legionellales bacterium]|tara:strand:+ start:13185 stop:13922 length:738 start_codon:yes stop_codon:yes gene_type:complete